MKWVVVEFMDSGADDDDEMDEINESINECVFVRVYEIYLEMESFGVSKWGRFGIYKER